MNITSVEVLVKNTISKFLTSNHKDVTDEPTPYAPPKQFVFPTKIQLSEAEKSRRVRQMAHEGKRLSSVHDLTSPEHSINNPRVLTLAEEIAIMIPQGVLRREQKNQGHNWSPGNLENA